MDAIKGGNNILIVSDRAVSATQVAIPALLASGAIHQHLVREGLRTTAGLVVETGSAREVHHFGVLAGYGAEAVHPLPGDGNAGAIHKDLPGDLSADKAIYNYVKAIGKGLSKIMSKMGVTHLHVLLRRAAVRGHRPEQRHDRQVLLRAPPAASRASASSRSRKRRCACTRRAFGDDPVLASMLDAGGEYAWRTRGEEHMWSPDAIAKLQHSTRANNWARTRNTPRSSTTRAGAT